MAARCSHGSIPALFLCELLTFKLFSLICINHIRQRYKEWRKYRIRVILVECHGNMACYVAYLFPV